MITWKFFFRAPLFFVFFFLSQIRGLHSLDVEGFQRAKLGSLCLFFYSKELFFFQFSYFLFLSHFQVLMKETLYADNIRWLDGRRELRGLHLY